MPYFHATYRRHLDAILKKGLDPAAEKQDELSKPGVYLAYNPLLAVGFLLERALAEPPSEGSPSDFLGSIVVIVVDPSRLDGGTLRLDDNIRREGFWLYAGPPIDVTFMPILSVDQASGYGLAHAA